MTMILGAIKVNQNLVLCLLDPIPAQVYPAAFASAIVKCIPEMKQKTPKLQVEVPLTNWY